MHFYKAAKAVVGQLPKGIAVLVEFDTFVLQNLCDVAPDLAELIARKPTPQQLFIFVVCFEDMLKLPAT